MRIRDARPGDLEQILRLNGSSVQFLSPLTSGRLRGLHAAAAYHRVMDQDSAVQAFLLALREGAAYDSPNYRWFSDRFDRFLYIDRIVVSEAWRGQGIARLLYEDLFSFARRENAGLVVCEFDVDPPNEPSCRFHERFGFEEVGTQRVGPNLKRVSLQAVSLPPEA